MSEKKNTKAITSLTVSSPGRICLFGEHQDYLMLPVISAAISLRISIEGIRRNDTRVKINLPDIKSKVQFSLGEELPYTTERDYFRSVINVLRSHEYAPLFGFDTEVRGKIPINAGTSSSSALVVSWVKFLSRFGDRWQEFSPRKCAQLAYEAEVLEFDEPGGMMDHYATSYGGVLYLDFFPALSIQPLQARLKSFVLGDSSEPKDTQDILARVKNAVLNITQRLRVKYKDFSLNTVEYDKLDLYDKGLTRKQRLLLKGTVRNRDITREAHILFQRKTFDAQIFASLLNEQQAILCDILKISTPKIDRMINAGLKAGALGGKINGSGGGGCMFVYAPKDPEVIAEAIAREGGTPYIIHIDEGTRIDRVK